MDRKIIAFIVALMVVIGGIFFYVNTDAFKKGTKQSLNKKEQSVNDENENKKDDTENQEGENQEEQGNHDLEKGKEAPDFTLKNLEGKEVSLSDYRGKIVLINFWATWCPWCDVEMPDIQKVDKENEDVVVLAVDFMEDKKTVSSYIEKGGYEFEVLLDEEGDISREYLVGGFPTSYFIDKEGKLVGGVSSAMNYAQIDEILQNIRGK